MAQLVTMSQDSIPMAADRGVGWAHLRDAGPVVQVGDVYYVTRREDVVAALKNPELFSSEEAFDQLGSPLPLVPIAFDPPDHTRYRKILQPFFSPRTLNALLPSLQAQVVELIDRIATQTECDAVAELAIPYPSQVFLTLFGLPLQDSDKLVAWKDAVIALSVDTGEGNSDIQPAIDLSVYLDERIQASRANPGDDILSKLLVGDTGEGEDDLDEELLDDGEALGLGFLFVLAGLDTVTSAVGFSLAALAQDPQLRRRLIEDPDQILEFVEEIVRLEPPAPILPRVATRDTEIGGVPIPKGTQVNLSLGAANREEGGSVATPDEIVLDGNPHRHWGFGGGPHRCLGSHLARIELKLVIGEWLKRIPDFELAPGADLTMPYPASTHALAALPLRLGTKD